MKKSGVFYHIFVNTLVCNVISAAAITNSRDRDVLNLNGIQDGGTRDKSNENKYKDDVGTETQQKRSFFKPDVNRRGSFYPSGGHGNTGFNVGSGINVGSTGYGSNYHTSGNGYSYGAPSLDYPPVIYGGSIPSHSGSSPSGGGYGTSIGHSGGGHLGGGGYGLAPGGHTGGGGGFSLTPGGHTGGGGFSLTPGGHAGAGGGGFNKAMALKGLLIPIAGVALLGAAAALAKSNPVLLQLGVVSGKKKRSIMSENLYPANPYVRPEYRKI